MFVKVASVLVGALLLLQNVYGQSCVCKCGPTGLFGEQDLCSASATPSGPLVVRPKALVKPSVTWPLLGTSSLKGPCFRRQAIVKPAVVPRPVYIQEQTQTQTYNNNNANLAEAAAAAAQILSQSSRSSSSSSSRANSISKASYSSQGGSTVHGSYQGVPGIDLSTAYKQASTSSKASAPADSVSLAIAYKLSQNDYNRKISEDRLTYGFRKLPIEQPVQKQTVYKNILPEQSLYTLNGQIVELKPVSEQASCDNLSEEAQEELLDLATSEEAENVQVARRPSLDELGYAPAKISSATFVNIPSVAEAPATSSSSVTCNDGFKTGSVVYKNYAKYEPVIQVSQGSLIDDTSCESQEEAVRHIAIPAPSCQSNYNGNVAGLVHSYSSSSKKSSASSSSHKSHKNSVVLEKLCS